MTAPKTQASVGLALPCLAKNAHMATRRIDWPPREGHDMKSPNLFALCADRQTAATTAHELAALATMSVGELADKYREVFGEPTHSRNKEFLRKRIAWRLQERAEGGLSPRALERIEQLAPSAPVRWRQPVQKSNTNPGPLITVPTRDPRLPDVGTVLTRVHDGVEHQVTVLADGFEYQGQRHRSLSKVARLITGTSWNGFLFFFGRPQAAPQAHAERTR
jgi:Protein of unknown function (DUF2924)